MSLINKLINAIINIICILRNSYYHNQDTVADLCFFGRGVWGEGCGELRKTVDFSR